MLADTMDSFDPGDADVAIAFKRSALRIRQWPPSTHWMITVMSTLDPAHAIFDKGYVRPREYRPHAAQHDDVVANPNGFFSGIPIPKRGSKKGKVSASFGSKVVCKDLNPSQPRDAISTVLEAVEESKGEGNVISNAEDLPSRSRAAAVSNAVKAKHERRRQRQQSSAGPSGGDQEMVEAAANQMSESLKMT